MSNSTPIRDWTTSSDFRGALGISDEKPVMVFKHSTRCPVSARAYREFDVYAESATERGVECVVVRVVENRGLSEEIATTLNVTHQSPQAILILAGQALWSESHHGVTVLALQAAEERARESSAGLR